MPQKQLGQTETAANTDTLLYTLPDNTEASNLTLTVANTGAAANFFKVYQDNDGAVHTTATALYFGSSGNGNDLAANTTVILRIGSMSNFSGTMYVAGETANEVTFTLHGIERLIA